jgi:N-acetylmuramoyl-L-alanine amidase
MTETRPSRARTIRLFFVLQILLAAALSPSAVFSSDIGQTNSSAARTGDQGSSRRDTAQAQFVRAEALRSSLEEKAESERTLKDYQAVVSSYRRVYLITPRAPEVPTAIKMVGDLYRRMGEQFDPKYFDSAIVTYEFLLHDYPANRYREEALLAVADIQSKNLAQPGQARQAYENFLKQYPRSSRASEARQALAELDAAEKASAQEKTPAAPVRPEAVSTPAQNSQINSVSVSNGDTYTRITIEFTGQMKYQAARLSDPDRIYFDIDDAKLSSQLLRKPIEAPSGGYLKTVRVAQNRSNLVRLVLEVVKARDFSVVELSDPARLVIDVYGPAADESSTSTAPKPAMAASAAESGAAKSPAKAADSSSHPRAPAAKPSAATMPPAAAPTSAAARDAADPITPVLIPKNTRTGAPSLTRILGLKIGRIVIDAGHGGHDTGTIGSTGLMEKDLCLDVALRLGKLIQQRVPSAEIVYTRDDDSFVPLEERTAIANRAKADLFLSIHANSSDEARIRGIETYYLNFNASPQALEVAARENALAQSSVHDLQDLVKKIARNEKADESRDLATDIQDSLVSYMRAASRPERNRGVRKAPFVVLISAEMPSALAEISFLSNPADEQWLKKPENRQRVAEGLYHGIEKYLRSTNSLNTNLTSSVEAPRGQ